MQAADGSSRTCPQQLDTAAATRQRSAIIWLQQMRVAAVPLARHLPQRQQLVPLWRADAYMLLRQMRHGPRHASACMCEKLVSLQL